MTSGVRLKVNSKADLLKELLLRCDRSGGKLSCWNWLYSVNKAGGQFRYKGKLHVAPRIMWETVHGHILGGLYVCHHCDNGLSINPEHLFLGTPKDNSDDKVRKGRQAKGTDLPIAILTDDDVFYI